MLARKIELAYSPDFSRARENEKAALGESGLREKRKSGYQNEIGPITSSGGTSSRPGGKPRCGREGNSRPSRSRRLFRSANSYGSPQDCRRSSKSGRWRSSRTVRLQEQRLQTTAAS